MSSNTYLEATKLCKELEEALKFVENGIKELENIQINNIKNAVKNLIINLPKFEILKADIDEISVLLTDVSERKIEISVSKTRLEKIKNDYEELLKDLHINLEKTKENKK